MSLFRKISILLLLVGFYSPAFAAVDGFEPAACNVYNDAGGEDKNGDKKEDGEEEPDCE